MASLNGLVEASTFADQKRKQPTKAKPSLPTDLLSYLFGDFDEVEIVLGKKFCIIKDLPSLKKDALIYLLQGEHGCLLLESSGPPRHQSFYHHPQTQCSL